MRFKELKWEHLAKVMQRLERGDLSGEAAKVAGLTVPVWSRVRKDWAMLEEHLAKVDPTGSPVDLALVDELIFSNRTNGGRPQGARDTEPRAKRTKQVVLADIVVTNPSIYVEDGYFYDD